MEKSVEDLTGKLKILKFRMGKLNDVITKQDNEALERQCMSVSTTSTMVNTSKESIEESMFSQGKGEEEVMEWAKESEILLAKADQWV